jgi:hypothetical protein
MLMRLQAIHLSSSQVFRPSFQQGAVDLKTAKALGPVPATRKLDGVAPRFSDPVER